MPVVGTALTAPRKRVAPVRIRVPSRGIDMRVVPVGVTGRGAMQLPENPAVAGWYRFGPDATADHGSVVLAAHVDSLRYGLGPFERIRDLPKGARVRLVDGRGDARTFTVTRIERVGKRDLPVRRVFDRAGPARLTLITCGGSFDEASRTYSDNVLVHARAAR